MRCSMLLFAIALAIGVSGCGCGGDDPPDTNPDGGGDDDGSTPGVDAGAPPLSAADPGNFASSVRFLFEGPTATQRDVDVEAFDARRLAVVRGQVQDANGEPIAGARVSVVGHAEHGYTTTLGDGWFSLAVNGGGRLVVRCTREGFLPVDREVTPAWNDFAITNLVVMTELDTQVTAVDLGASTMQVARASSVEDEDGARQATILFPASTSATMQVNGTSMPLTRASVRATEFTVGDRGPDAMPAALPATSAYTYAVELSVDEALAAGATRVDFDRPVIVYLENFLAFPAGTVVPLGYYDREQTRWIASEDGRVIDIVGIDAGRALVDVDGDGSGDSGEPLSALGITDEERTQLASLYTTGTSLWRAPVRHFTPWDCNWPYTPPDDAEQPDVPPPIDDPPPDCNESKPGSIIECQSRVFGERVRIPGTPYHLSYQSHRTVGASATVDIQLTGESVPSSLRAVRVTFEIAGRREIVSFPPEPRLTHTYVWDGLDAWGRRVLGSRPLTIRIEYVYPTVYTAPNDFQRAFARFPRQPVQAIGDGGRFELSLTETFTVSLSSLDIRGIGLGGWTLSAHHMYDVQGGALLYGNGARRTLESGRLGRVLALVAGNGGIGTGGDDGPAINAELIAISALLGAPDGSLYIGDGVTVRRVRPDGIIEHVVGNGAGGSRGDGGPASLATFATIAGLALTDDGNLIIADFRRVRRIGSDGIIRTIAGNGMSPTESPASVNGRDATQVSIGDVRDMATGPDGSIYIVTSQSVVQRIALDGTIDTVAGNGVATFAGDGGPATLASLYGPQGIAVLGDGTLIIADTANHRLRSVTPDGTIDTFAGMGTFQGPTDTRNDGQPARQAFIESPYAVEAGPDGSVYVNAYERQANERRGAAIIGRVMPDGIFRTAVGGDAPEDAVVGNGAPSRGAPIVNSPQRRIAIDARGDVLFSERTRVFRAENVLPGFRGDQVAVADESGAAIDVFDENGRHLQTLDVLTGVALQTPSYDDAGRIASITDRDGDITRIERDANGAPTAIVGPFGQRTMLALDAQGYLEKMTFPNGATNAFEYDEGGLMTAHVDALEHRAEIVYDDDGRLARETNELGGTQTLRTSEETSSRRVIEHTSAEGLLTRFTVDRLAYGEHRRTELPDGAASESIADGSGITTKLAPDGTVTRIEFGPDPIFGMQAPQPARWVSTTPAGIATTVTHERTASGGASTAGEYVPASFVDTLTVNGRAFTATYDAAQRRQTFRSPEGREISRFLDERGRIIREETGGLAPLEMSYDTHGRISEVRRGDRMVTYAYDAAGKLSSRDSGIEATAYGYDDAGNVVSQEIADRTVMFAYDDNGNLTGLTPPDGAAHVLRYDAAGNIVAHDAPAVGSEERSTAVEYDLDGRVTRVDYPAGETLRMLYGDSNGRLVRVQTNDGSIDYGHDGQGRIVSMRTPEDDTVSFAYDGALVTRMEWLGRVAGTVSQTFTNDLTARNRSVNGTIVATYAYDNDGLLVTAGGMTLTRHAQHGAVEATDIGEVNETFVHDGFGELAEHRVGVDGSSFYGAEYERDALGRIVRSEESISGDEVVRMYTYDDAGRLAVVSDGTDEIARYTYDANDNRVGFQGDGDTLTGMYDAQDRLVSYGPFDYVLNASGRLVSRRTRSSGATRTFSYDPRGNLQSVVLESGVTIEYVLDALGRRVGKLVDGDFAEGWLYQDALRPVAWLDASGDVAATFVYASRQHVPDLMRMEGRTYRLVTDIRGSVRAVVDTASGAVAQRIDYDPFGIIESDTSPGFQPFGFAGGLYDADTGLVHFGAREYDAFAGRWTRRDPAGFSGGDSNLFAYAHSDPINRIDPSGRFDWEAGAAGVIAGALGGFIGGGGAGGVIGGIVSGVANGYEAGDLRAVMAPDFSDPNTMICNPFTDVCRDRPTECEPEEVPLVCDGDGVCSPCPTGNCLPPIRPASDFEDVPVGECPGGICPADDFEDIPGDLPPIQPATDFEDVE